MRSGWEYGYLYTHATFEVRSWAWTGRWHGPDDELIDYEATDGDFLVAVNELGEAGWELVTVERADGSDLQGRLWRTRMYHFKRPRDW